MITSRPEVPRSLSSPWVPAIVARERLHFDLPPALARFGGGGVTLVDVDRVAARLGEVEVAGGAVVGEVAVRSSLDLEHVRDPRA